MSNNPIPIVDFTPFLDKSAKQQAADQLLGSFKSAGFVYITNFGIPAGEVQEMFDWVGQPPLHLEFLTYTTKTETLFCSPHETKMLAPHPDSGSHHRGYSYPCQEKEIQYSDSGDEFTIAPPSMKESFECGSEDNDFMPNIWLPDGVLPGFNEACLSFFWKCHEVEQNILRALALGFGLEEEWFLKYHETANSQLRLHHYPSIFSELLETNKLTRISAHTDFDTLTFLFQGEIGGLEVEDPNEPGKYVPVPPIPNSIVLNAGDFAAM
ncbi:uncharacterized protein F5891DRAFT_1195090 [Suillus fuscotomentosus]|uniref:Fe2OG dioxygenase domain-containing protein n=1 Tax=Suillus fuscotomentosus TaxID=1912939 RepID=A0AAD4DVC2_9AGAM|nr:uncharacterized protein F5891DRAFT_1195090 [Suillus fuscotomentosus]KAG1894639.1 hypothetical protein F5891DRAFT_1195090 [Suillus fuscotomentosus]